MNVDGESGNNIKNVIIVFLNDNIFVFLEVTIDPTNTNTPYLVSDSILFITGNNHQDIDLIATVKTLFSYVKYLWRNN